MEVRPVKFGNLPLVPSMISIEHFSKTYSSDSPPAVDDFSLEIRDGELLGLVGLNGAGKSTTIRMASGIILPASGKITVDGYDIVQEKIKASSEWVGYRMPRTLNPKQSQQNCESFNQRCPNVHRI